MPNFREFTWGRLTRFHCPEPCSKDHGTKEEAERCWAACDKQPKPTVRTSEILDEKGAEVQLVEIPDPPKRRKKSSDADATVQS